MIAQRTRPINAPQQGMRGAVGGPHKAAAALAGILLAGMCAAGTCEMQERHPAIRRAHHCHPPPPATDCRRHAAAACPAGLLAATANAQALEFGNKTHGW